MRQPLNPLMAILASAFLSLLAGCLFENSAGRGSVVENEVLAGILYTESGIPAAGAMVRVYPVSHIPNKNLAKRGIDTTLVYSYVTDGKGRFKADNLPFGQYNFFGEWEGKASFQDSVIIGEKSDSIPSDTLRAPGSVTGFSVLEPNHDPRTLYVQVLGSNHFVTADSTGRFTVRGLAPGSYAFRAATTLADYSPAFGRFRIETGRLDTLKDTLKLVYTGIPVVRGLSAHYDTALAQVRISWSPARFPFLKEYLIYRTESTSITPATTPIAKVSDTFYVDDLSEFATGPWPLAPGGKPVRFEYLVRVRNLSDVVGLPFGSVPVTAIPIAAVRTLIRFSSIGSGGRQASIGDSIRYAGQWENPVRDHDSLEWFMETEGAKPSRKRITGKRGADTLGLRLPVAAGTVLFTLRIWDAVGNFWDSTTAIEVVKDAPIAIVNAAAQVTIGDSIALKGYATQAFGTIVKWEWDIGNTGNFKTSRQDTSVTAPLTPGLLACVLRVTDDDGNIALDTAAINVIDDTPKLTLRIENQRVSEGGGYRLASTAVDSGRIAKWEWRIGLGGFKQSVRGDTILHPTEPPGTILDCSLRATDEDGNSAVASGKITVSRWGYVGEALRTNFPGALIEYGGRLLLWQDSHLYQFDFPNGIWKTERPQPTLNAILQAARLNGKVFFLGENPTPPFQEYDFSAATEKSLAAHPQTPVLKDFGMAAMGGRIWVVGAYSFSNYNPETGAWTVVSDFLKGVPGLSAVAISGKLFAIGSGYNQSIGQTYVYDTTTASWEVKSWMPHMLTQVNAVALNGKIHVTGTTVDNSTAHFVYDPLQDSWKEKSRPLWGVNPRNSAVLGGKIYSVSEGKMHVYDPAADP